MTSFSNGLEQPIGGLPQGRKVFGQVATALCIGCVVAIVLPLVWVMFDVVKEGFSSLTPATFFNTRFPPPGRSLTDGDYGFGHAIVGSLIVLSIAAALSFPFGILAAVYLSEFGRGTRLAYLVKFSCNVLTGVPAIISGLFAYAIFVRGSGFSAFSGGVALGVLMLPIVIRSTEEALFLVPLELRQGAIGIGSTRFQSTVRIVLPAAASGIVTGLILSLARAAGEAAPLLFTSFNNVALSTDIWRGIATLPVLIYDFAKQPYEAQRQLAWAAALVLLAIVLSVSLLSRFVTRQKSR